MERINTEYRNLQIGHLYYLNEEHIGLHHNQDLICSTEMCELTWEEIYIFLH